MHCCNRCRFKDGVGCYDTMCGCHIADAPPTPTPQTGEAIPCIMNDCPKPACWYYCEEHAPAAPPPDGALTLTAEELDALLMLLDVAYWDRDYHAASALAFKSRVRALAEKARR